MLSDTWTQYNGTLCIGVDWALFRDLNHALASCFVVATLSFGVDYVCGVFSEDLVWLIGAVVCLIAALQVQLFADGDNG